MKERGYITRREFNKAFVVGTLATGLSFFQYKINNIFNPFTENNNLDFLDYVKGNSKYPKEFVGIGFNAPYIWTRSKEEINDFINLCEESDAKMIRINPDCGNPQLEKGLGKLDQSVLGMYMDFIEKVPENINIIFPILDYFYEKAEKRNAVYGAFKSNSPYLNKDLFTDKDCNNAYDNRIKVFSLMANLYPNVYLEIGNEIASSIKGKKGIEINSRWYLEKIGKFRESYNKILLSGLHNSKLINIGKIEGFLNTEHNYPGQKINKLNLPYVLEEVGYPQKLARVDLPNNDILLENYIVEYINNITKSGVIQAGGVMIYQAGLHDDNYNINRLTHPKTLKLLQILSGKLKQSFGVPQEQFLVPVYG